MRTVQVTDISTGVVLGDRIQLADNSLTRLVGLLGRRSLDAGAGLWIKPCSGVHTLGMSFPIDVIGLDKQLNVIALWHSLVPNRLTKVDFRQASVVELPAGSLQQSSVQIGHTLSIVAV